MSRLGFSLAVENRERGAEGRELFKFLVRQRGGRAHYDVRAGHALRVEPPVLRRSEAEGQPTVALSGQPCADYRLFKFKANVRRKLRLFFAAALLLRLRHAELFFEHHERLRVVYRRGERKLFAQVV